MKNLKVEKIVSQFKGHPSFRLILRDIRDLLVKGLKNNRIGHRPLLLAIAKIDEMYRLMREEGAKQGLKFPAEAPSRKIFGPNVYLLIKFPSILQILLKETKDFLYHESETLFPLPKLDNVLKGVTMDESDPNKEIIESNVSANDAALEKYQLEVQTAYMDLWKMCSDGFLNLQALINFFL